MGPLEGPGLTKYDEGPGSDGMGVGGVICYQTATCVTFGSGSLLKEASVGVQSVCPAPWRRRSELHINANVLRPCLSGVFLSLLTFVFCA